MNKYMDVLVIINYNINNIIFYQQFVCNLYVNSILIILNT